ncbi:MAG: NAD-dependent epimerase/dehydratase family protein [Candidatus Omnitrophica bacterium]|nr:NAD-dependent epimerase/dehydratase family protein [Candidatus Omnitrophota bacterium]
MKYLIIGSEGFLGKALSRVLSSSQGDILLKADLALEDKKAKNEYQIDLKDTSKLVSLCETERPDVIFNLAGIFNSPSPVELFTANCFAPVAFLEAAAGLNCKLILIGSAAEYGATRKGKKISEDFALNPLSDYGISKACQSFMAMRFAKSNKSPQVVIARLFNMIGSGMHSSLFLGGFARQVVDIEKGLVSSSVIKTGNLESYRDLLPVKAVAECLKELAIYGEHAEVYNICSSRPVKIGDVLQQLLKLARKKISFEVDPAKFKANDIPWSVGENKKISRFKKIDFTDVQLKAAIRETLDWYRGA